jgi:hypothetical protein
MYIKPEHDSSLGRNFGLDRVLSIKTKVELGTYICLVDSSVIYA